MSAVEPSLSPATKWPRALLAFELLVILPTIAGVTVLFVHTVESSSIAQMIVLTGLLAFVEALPVPALRGVHLSLGFPLLMTYGILMNPPAAALVAFVGSFDPRELRHEVTFLRAVFNRCQVALSVLAASAVFHRIATIGPPASSVWLCVAGAMLAALADYVVNSSLVTIFTSLRVGVSPLIVIRELRIGRLSEFLISYLGPGFCSDWLARCSRFKPPTGRFRSSSHRCCLRVKCSSGPSSLRRRMGSWSSENRC